MEFIIIDGERVEVPAEIVTAGRLAVQAWHLQQLTARKIAFTVAANGDPLVTLAGAPAPDVTTTSATHAEE